MAYAYIETWKPQAKIKTILDAAKEHIDSVPYKVSVRWAFYRVWQDGYYDKTKSDAKNKAYTNFCKIASRARHSGMWEPDLLADDTRSMSLYYNDGDAPEPDIETMVEEGIEDAESDIRHYREKLNNYRWHSSYTVDPNFLQDYFFAVIFEARAMAQQFEAYTDGVTLCPFGGQASIPYKYEIAKYLEDKASYYQKPVKVLYFGDKDEAGEDIFETGKEDISKWCGASIDFVRCGLTDEQIAYYDIPESAEKPGFQWEALTDKQAAAIIRNGMEPYFNFDAKREAEHLSASIQSEVERRVNDAFNPDDVT